MHRNRDPVQENGRRRGSAMLVVGAKGGEESMKDECCPQFDPTPWNEATFTWEGKRFVKDRVTSFLHIPLNFGGVMKRNMKSIEAFQAEPATPMVLSDENSLWGA
ncbi:MAG: hypothetical protein IT304_13360, partial [Dehalococcoidia bacterium]|nr:hypothetical protein [Dehalococcoidia bacterium]